MGVIGVLVRPVEYPAQRTLAGRIVNTLACYTDQVIGLETLTDAAFVTVIRLVLWNAATIFVVTSNQYKKRHRSRSEENIVIFQLFYLSFLRLLTVKEQADHRFKPSLHSQMYHKLKYRKQSKISFCRFRFENSHTIFV